MANQFSIKIELGNDAMRTRRDVVRVLRELAATIDDGSKREEGKIRDANGNSVGSWSFD